MSFSKNRNTGVANNKQTAKKSGWLEVGTIFGRKDGSGFFLSVKADVTLKEGDNLQLRTPQERIEGLLKAGQITEEQAETRLSKVPSTIKFDVVLPPRE